MFMLEELWNSIPFVRRSVSTKEYKELLQQVVAMQKELSNELSPQGRETLDNMCCKSNEMHAFEESDAFVCGFRLGVQILLDAIGKYDGVSEA